ncbi:MAG: CHAT domain-containing protein [Bacteroidota bacterium]
MLRSFLSSIVVLVLLGAAFSGHASGAQEKFSRGMALKDAQEYSAAYLTLDSAADLAAQAQDWPVWAEARIKAATCLGKDRRALEAVQHLEATRARLPEKFTREDRLAYQLRVDRSLAYYYRRLNAVNQALHYQIEVLQARQELNADSSALAQSHLNIGVRLLEKNDLVQAKTYLQRGMALAEGDPRYQTKFLTNLGKLAMAVGEPAVARGEFQRAYDLRREHAPADAAGLAGAKLFLASATLAARDLEATEALLEDARAYLAALPAASDLWGDLESHYAKLWLLRGDPERAIAAGRAALRWFTGGNYLDREAGIQYIENGEMLLELGELDAAEAAFRAGLGRFLPLLDSISGPYALPELDAERAQPWIIEALRGCSQVGYRRYQNTGAAADLAFSLAALDRAVEQAAIVRRAFISPDARLGLSGKVYDLYETAILRALELSQAEPGESFKQAFNFAEQGKAAVLLEEIAAADRSSGLAVPEAIRTELDELDLNYRVYRELAEEASGEMKVTYAEQRDEALRRRLERQQAIASDYPAFIDVRYNQAPIIDLAELQTRLQPDEALIEYFVGDENLVVFLVTRAAFSVQRSALPPDLADNIRGLRASISATGRSELLRDFRKYGRVLYQQVAEGWVNALPPEINAVTIIPDGPLSYVPFEVLLSEDPGRASYPELPFLIRKYRFSYGYSATLRYRERRSVPLESAQVLACALSFRAQVGASMRSGLLREELPELTNVTREMEAIRAHFSGEFLVDESATETSFRTLAPEFGLLHLATHTVFNEAVPDATRIVFSEEKGDSDGYLHAYELYGLTLKADLAVLSACQTGDGELLRGEGVMSLGRAFTYAGCKSTVMTLWPLNDDAAGDIMASFYGYLAEGQPKDAALHRAKLDYLDAHAGPQASPFFWAAFVQSGDVSPVAPKRGIPAVYWIAPVGGVPIVILLLLFWRRRARRAKETRPVRVRMK